MAEKERLVVIGNGMGGARFVEELLALKGNDRFEIVMFGDEPYGNYNRILLSNVIAGTDDPKNIFLNTISWYEQNQIKLHAGVRVGFIDREAGLVVAPGGIQERYDRLVFATGSRPFIPPIRGVVTDTGRFKDGVYLFRTLDDSLQMVESAKHSKKVVVIGGGLLGLEAARGLLNQGMEVHVVELAPHLMAVQLDETAGRMLKETLEDMGIHIHVGTSVASMIGDGAVEGVVFSDGTVEPCDMLVISAGIRPNVELAKTAGLTVKRGIEVGDDLASVDDSSIYGIGECIEHRGRTYGLVAPTFEQAQVLAQRLSGASRDAVYTGSSTSTKLKVMGVDLVAVGEKDAASESDEVVTYADANHGIYKKLIVRDGKLAGAILLGDGTGSPRLLQVFQRGEQVPDDRAELLFPMDPDQGQSTVADSPDSLQICNCNGVTKGTIKEAIHSGKHTLRSVCEGTRAGLGCGSCKVDVQAILEAESDSLESDPSVHYYVPGIPLRKAELIAAIKGRYLRSVSSVLEALSDGADDARTKLGLASLLKTVWGAAYEDERDSRFINDRVHANIQNDGTFSVVPRLLGGVVTPDQLRTIANVADKYQVPMVKLTGGQRIDLLGVPKSQLPDVWKDLGMPSGHAYTKSVRTVKTCVGEEFCRFGLGNSTKLGIDIEKKYQGIETPHKVKMAVNACPRNCAEATTKDVGVVGIEGGRWQVYVGGAAGSTVRKGDMLCVVDTHEEVLTFVGRFIQYYRENANFLERTHGFVERIGIVELARILVTDAEGIAARLDNEINRIAGEYADPWQEGVEPRHPLQFSEELAGVEVGTV
jgi:nitrite reductase (NADH) large subunit